MLQPDKPHLESQIPPDAHTSMYIWHKYWARKTWNVVGDWIETYSPAGGVVIDPFMGSGIAIIEALKRGRRAIGIDLNPIAVEIVDLTLRDVDLGELQAAYDRVEKAVAKKIEALYRTTCRSCKKEIDAACYIWKENKPQFVRYECSECESREIKGKRLNEKDKEILETIDKLLQSSKLWYPQDPLYYPDGTPFLKKEKYETIADLYTKRNLYALAILMRQIEKEDNELLKRFLKITFSSMVHNCTKMMPIGNPADTNHYTYYSSPGWTQHSYWYVPNHMEQPVWRKFKSAFLGPQGLLKAKEETTKIFKKPIKFAKTLDQFISGKADVLLINGSAMSTLRAWREKKHFRDYSDYCFTDPPYASSIQYGELSYMWVKWLKLDGNYTRDLCEHEVVENPKQHKDFKYYDGMLSSTLGELNQALKPGAHMTLTFHNPTFKVRNATIRAGVRNNFDFEKIHHQPLAVKSAKSLLQPFGSATGDFYLRFSRPEIFQTTTLSQWNEQRFERVVVDGVKHLLAERWEPTPYTFIINFIDPLLAREGFFQELYPGLDVSTVLKNHQGITFDLVDIKIGSTAGKAWWFKHPESVKQKGIPLSERVEKSVVRELLSKVRVTFTDIWRRIGEEFPNSMTPDALSIRDVLREYATEASRGEWQVLNKFRERVNQHATMIQQLAELGKELGYNVWIGRNEQRDFTHKRDALGSLVSVDIKVLKFSGETLRAISDIDVLWIQKNKIISAFEVEYSTTITSAIERGAHLPDGVKKYIVLPEERIPKLKRKLESAFFREGFLNEKWSILLFDQLLDQHKDLSSKKIKIEEIIWDMVSNPNGRDTGQLKLV